MLEGVGSFLGLNFFIFATAMLAFTSPLFCKLSEHYLVGANALSCGLLVGCCLFIILPEGFSSDEDADHGAHGADGSAQGGGDHESGPSVALLLGFISQLLIDVLINRKGGHGHHHHQSPAPHNMIVSDSLDDSGVSLTDIKDPSRREEETAGQRPLLLPSPPPSPPKLRGASSTASAAGLKVSVDPTAGMLFGLVLHCIADGIALGSSSLSENEALRASVFAAMAMHKIPMAFGTGALVHQQQLSAASTVAPPPLSHRRLIFLRWALIFSLSSPLSALFTYLLLGMTEAGAGGHSSGKWVQEGMMFSAGTFLFVTIGHIMPELLHSHHMRGPQGLRQLGLVVAGLLAMFVLASLAGHDHR